MGCELLQMMPALGYEAVSRMRWREFRDWHAAAAKVHGALRAAG